MSDKYRPLTVAGASRTVSFRQPRRVGFGIVLASVAVVLMAVGAWFFLAPSADDGLLPDPNVRVGSLTEAGKDLDKMASEAMVSFSINSEPRFSDGTAPGNLLIENMQGNNNRFTVVICLLDDNREVYRSGAIDPGQYIESAPLSVDLPAGDYPARATLYTYRLSDDSPIGQVAAELLLKVEA